MNLISFEFECRAGLKIVTIIILYDACPNDGITPTCPICGMERLFQFDRLLLVHVWNDCLGPATLHKLFIHDSKVWRNAYKKTGIFGGDSRGINLSLCVNPFRHLANNANSSDFTQKH